MFFVRHNGGSVWFDSLGKPWPKHACFFDDMAAVRLRLKLAETVEQGTRYFGVVAETEVTAPGEAGRIVIRCSDGQIIEDHFRTNVDLTDYPGSLVLVDESAPGRYMLERIEPDATVIEVYHCERFEQAVIYDPNRQDQIDAADTRMWMCGDRCWKSLRTFHIWRRLSRVDGLAAAQLADEYQRVAPPTRGEGFGALIECIRTGRHPPKVVKVKVFAGTPYERLFRLPATLTAEQITEWVRQIEALLGPEGRA